MSETEIPCNTCLSWNQENKSFSCDPKKCLRLSDWLLKYASELPDDSWVAEVQYIV